MGSDGTRQRTPPIPQFYSYLQVGVIDAVVHDAPFVVGFLEQPDHCPRRHIRVQSSGPYLFYIRHSNVHSTRSLSLCLPFRSCHSGHAIQSFLCPPFKPPGCIQRVLAEFSRADVLACTAVHETNRSSPTTRSPSKSNQNVRRLHTPSYRDTPKQHKTHPTPTPYMRHTYTKYDFAPLHWRFD